MDTETQKRAIDFCAKMNEANINSKLIIYDRRHLDRGIADAKKYAEQWMTALERASNEPCAIDKIFTLAESRDMYYMSREFNTLCSTRAAILEWQNRDIRGSQADLSDMLEKGEVCLPEDANDNYVYYITDFIELEGVELGEFEVRIYPGYIEAIALEPNPAASDPGVTHPHVNDGHICFGDAQAAITGAQNRCDICSIKDIVNAVLYTYNPLNPYVKLETWEDDGNRCELCGNHDELYVCEGCDTQVCYECSYECYECERVYCENCSYYCTHCGRPVCENCVYSCAKCGNYTCSNCREECTHCQETYCRHCMSDVRDYNMESMCRLCAEDADECESCGVALHRDDASPCERCGKVFCPDCDCDCEEETEPIETSSEMETL